MLHWSIALVAIPAALVLLAMSAAFRHAMVVVARTIYRVVNRIGAWTSASLDIVLRPNARNGRAGLSRVVLWLGVNIAAMVAVYHLRMTHQETMALAGAGLLVLLHVLLLTASILVIAEENRVMHLGQPKNGARFSPHAALRDLMVIALEAVLTLASAAVLLDMLSAALPGAVVTHTPDTGSSFADHLLCLLFALPGMGALVAMTEFAGDIAFGGRFGGVVRGAIYALGSTLLYGAAAAWLYQRSATAMILSRLEEADGDDAHFLQLILSRAPQHIKADLLALALDAERPLVQMRAINIMRHLKVWTFLHHLDRFERKVKTTGLNQIREFLASDGPAFDDELIVSGARKALEQSIALAPKVENAVEDAVLSRLGTIVASYMSLIQTRRIGFNTTPEQYGVMLEIAKTHKDNEVRRAMARTLVSRGAKRFLMGYLVKMHERPLSTVDIEIIEELAAHARAKAPSLSDEDRDVLARRLNWNIWHAGLPSNVTLALKGLQSALGQSRAAAHDGNRADNVVDLTVDPSRPISRSTA